MSLKIIYINNKKFFCRGNHNTLLGHPAASLIINPISKKAICPYCSTVYVYND